MKRIAAITFLTIILFILFAMGFGKLKVYDPEHKEIHIAVTKVEQGDSLVNITEIDALLMIMLVGAFIIFK